jgi:penicillin-binding protein 2
VVNRSNILYYFTIILMGILALRLFQLQIVEHQKYKVLAKNNTTRTAITRAPRGIIYDRHGNILATSKQSLSVIVYPAALTKQKDKESVARLLCTYVNMSYEDLYKIFDEMEPTTPLPLTLENDVGIETAIRIFENQKQLPGIAVENQAIRYYPYQEITGHLLGYVGQINSNELEAARLRGLGLGDIVGKEALEKVFDESLQGVKGEARVSVDRYGRSLKEGEGQKKIIKNPIKGEDLHLSIDIKLQQVAYEALENKQGAVVAMNPKTGEILVLVSSPSYDPNIFTKPVPTAVFNDLMNRKAFVNRAISSFTPGSVWKPFTSLVALQKGVLNPAEKLRVSGSYNYGGFNFGDWTGKVDIVDLRQALAWSRNTYFYQIADRMKPEWIAEVGRNFGVGTKTNIELLGESNGVLPSPEWKKKNMKESWYPGNTLHYSIGQSYLLISPLQLARMYAGLATKGLIPSPHLVKDPNKVVIKQINSYATKNYDIVEAGLKECIETGTGQASKLVGIKLAGKTGSAEVKGYAHTTHGWFAAYGPVENPEIVIVVFMEGAGHGGTVAAPVAKKVFDEYFKDKIKKPVRAKTRTVRRTRA